MKRENARLDREEAEEAALVDGTGKEGAEVVREKGWRFSL